MTTPAQHTALSLPLRAIERPHTTLVDIVEHDGRLICPADSEDAAYIVRACNSYPDLLEACKDALYLIEGLHGDLSDEPCEPCTSEGLCGATECNECGCVWRKAELLRRAIINAALARAEQSSPREKE